MKRLRRPTLGSKILILFILAFVLMGVLAWGFGRTWRGPWRDQIPKVAWINTRAHLINIIDDCGSPPSEAKMRETLRYLKLEAIVRENDKTLFQIGRSLPSWEAVEREVQTDEARRAAHPRSIRSRLGDFVVGRVEGRMFAMLSHDDRQYAFFLQDRGSFQRGLRAFGGFAFAMAFLLLIVLGVMHWLLRPMKPLVAGVNELSKGNLDYRISIRPRGEFQNVADAFNALARTIQRQLQSKDRLLMDVSHELRSPLGRLKMAAEMLPPSTGEGGADLRSQIQSDLKEMEELVSELLEIYRFRDVGPNGRGVESLEAIDMAALLREVVGPLVQQRPGVKYDLPVEPVIVSGDRRQVKRAIRNVIENAVKFSKHQDRPVEVSLSIERDGVGDLGAADGISGGGLSKEPRVVVRVRDHGVGMTPEEQERVFETFYRADSSRVRETGGFGLGLSLAKAVIEAHGGEISCSSERGRGAEFQMSFKLGTVRRAE
ncbi:MAG: HAMP domain-containing sensor histidine kinase [Bdellovibrionales bacterium]|jgi:signal transduction histidine kinase|nr:HAMP domain-containing sensor histidine kinase [Bdellovibrionales bacterium]